MEIQLALDNEFDPGPVDQSVLVWQHEHRSAAIWEDQNPPRELTCRHKLLGMRDWPLDPRVCRHVIEFGLFGVYKVAFIQLDYALITALVERWRPETHTFHLPVGETSITLQDTAILLGLRVDGPAVTGSTKHQWADVCEELLGLRPGPKDLHGSHVTLGWLRDNFQNLSSDADELTVQRHTRAFVLALMSGFLYGDKSKHDVALTCLPLLQDFGEAACLSWGSAALSLLYRELCRASKRTVSTICGPLVLLQLWAWERLHVGRPGRLKGPTASHLEGIEGPIPDPLGCRWRASLSHKENPRGGLDFYRDQFDQQKDDQMIWQPYTRDLLEKLPPICLSGESVWRTVAPLICFDVVEWHRPDRVLRQFGFRQTVPMLCDNEKALHAIDKRGKSEYDWSARHRQHIELWDSRHSTVVAGEPESGPMDYHDPYMDWYRQITRKIISPLKERRPGQFQPTGFAVQLLVQRVATIHARCRATLDDEVTLDIAKQRLQEIHDMCSGILQITAPLGSLPGGSPLQVPMLESQSVQISTELLAGQHLTQPSVTEKSELDQSTITATAASRLKILPPTTSLELEWSASSTEKTLLWPSGGKLSFSWICDVMLVFDWSSRNVTPAGFSSILPINFFNELVLSATKILKREPNCVKINSNSAKVVVVGDIIGQLHDLIFLLQEAGFPDDDQFYVFNGNYVGKGAWGLESFLLLLAWKVYQPERVFLLRGNHETEYCTTLYGFRNEVLTKYGDKGLHVYKKCLDCFQLLPLASLIGGQVFTAHGGLFRSPQQKRKKRKRNQREETNESDSFSLGSLEELSKARRRVSDPPMKGSNLIPGDILWSDPSMDDGLFINKERGKGLYWGPDCTKKFLKENNLKLIIRANQDPDVRKKRKGFPSIAEGYAKDHEGLITLFSAPDYPQSQETNEISNNKGAYIILRLPEVEEPEFHSFEATRTPKVRASYNYMGSADVVEKLKQKTDNTIDSEPKEAIDQGVADSVGRSKFREEEAKDQRPMVIEEEELNFGVELVVSDDKDADGKLDSPNSAFVVSDDKGAADAFGLEGCDRAAINQGAIEGENIRVVDNETDIADSAEKNECWINKVIDSETVTAEEGMNEVKNDDMRDRPMAGVGYGRGEPMTVVGTFEADEQMVVDSMNVAEFVAAVDMDGPDVTDVPMEAADNKDGPFQGGASYNCMDAAATARNVVYWTNNVINSESIIAKEVTDELTTDDTRDQLIRSVGYDGVEPMADFDAGQADEQIAVIDDSSVVVADDDNDVAEQMVAFEIDQTEHN